MKHLFTIMRMALLCVIFIISSCANVESGFGDSSKPDYDTDSTCGMMDSCDDYDLVYVEMDAVYVLGARVEGLRRVPASDHVGEVEDTRVTPTRRAQPLSGYALGQVAYEIPDTMRLFEHHMVRVRVASSTLVDPSAGMTRYTMADIRTTPTMEVDLVDPTGGLAFSIVRATTSKQLIEDGEYTEWVFDVTPLLSGSKKLNLVVSAIIGGERKQAVYTDTVAVKSSPGKHVRRWWEKYWQWAFTTLIIPVVTFFWKRRDKQS